MNHRLLTVLVAASVLLASCNAVGTSPPTTYTVTYDGNAHDSGTVPVDGNAYETGDTVTVLGNTGSLAKAGVLFNGWNTAPGGGGTVRMPGTTFQMGSADQLLYAQWEPDAGLWDDLAVLDVFIESTGCGFGSDETVVAKVANLGPADIAEADIELAVSFNGGAATTIEEVIDEVIPSGGSVQYHFGAIDLSAPGTYELVVTVTIPDDGLPSNDSQSLTVENVSGATTLPYAEDFENGAAGWTVHGANPSWALAMPASAIIDSAGSGAYAWVTNPAGNYGAYETGYLTSPCLDFTGAVGTVVLTFGRIFDTEACCDGGWVELSIDGGASWTKLVDIDGSATNWYNDTVNQRWAGATDGWQEASIDLPAGTSGTAVRLRFVFASDGTISREGFGIDHVRVNAG